MESLKIGKEKFTNVLWLNERIINNYIHKMADSSLTTREFRILWDEVLGRLSNYYFNSSYMENNIGIGIILRAGIAELLAAKKWILKYNFPVFLIWTARKEDEGNVTADMLNCNLPKNAPNDMKIAVIDLMCARGVSSGRTLEHIKAHNIEEKNTTFLFGVSAPEGLVYLRDNFPEVKIITAYTGDHIGLNEKNYIVYKDSGKMVVGDAGDRWMGVSSKGELVNLNNNKGGENDR